ncbi:glycosyltransferase family 9 protein, partial [Bordetella hinzii]|nr:glycosyltransferase family 9 protein [Bordetella hinzii]
ELALFGVTRRERTGPWSARAVCLGAEGAWPSLAEVEDTALAQLRGSPE